MSCIDRPAADFTLLGRPAWFTRRRYGRTTFTWVHVEIDGELVDLGDPWPCITPKRKDMEAALTGLLACRSQQTEATST